MGIVTGISEVLAPKISGEMKLSELTRVTSDLLKLRHSWGSVKSKAELGWEPEITAQEMCKEMVEEDHKAARRFALLKEHDLELPVSIEN